MSGCYLVELGGIEPPTSCVQGRRSPSWAITPNNYSISCFTTPDSLLRVIWWVWVDSNHRPHPYQGCALTNWATDPGLVSWAAPRRVLFICNSETIYVKAQRVRFRFFLKEVIQPQLPLGLPCYDFTPVMNHKVVSVLPKVRLPTSFATHSHGVTGGVYKARERIHRNILICDY